MKCKYWINRYCQFSGKGKIAICPDGRLNNQCAKDMRTPKKPRMVRITKWWSHPDIVRTKNNMVWMADKKSVTYSIPVVILINRKYISKRGTK